MQDVIDQSTVDEVTRRFWVPPLWSMVCAFLLVLLISGYVLVWRPSQLRNAIAIEIESIGGSVIIQEIGPGWIRQLSGSPALTRPSTRRRGGLLDRIIQVHVCPKGRPPGGRVEVSSELVTDLPAFGALTWLDLNYTNATDDWMPAIAELQSLQRLSLSHTRVGGRGFHRLRTLPDLCQLDLAFCPVRKQYLDELVELKSLRHLNLYECSHLSLNDVEAFETARPDVKVNFHVRNHP